MKQEKQVQISRNTDNTTLIKQVGTLRVLLAAMAVFCLLMLFFRGGDDTGWYVIPAHVAPALVILTI